MGLHALTFHAQPGDGYRTGRTLRSLRLAGLWAEDAGPITGLPARLRDPALQARGGVLLVRAGVWLVRSGPFQAPPSSATGRGLCALGGVQPAPVGNGTFSPSPLALKWQAWQRQTGGDFSRITAPQALAELEPASLFLDALALKELSVSPLDSLGSLLQVAQARLRLVHHSPLDVYEDPSLRVVQLITALQRGGAERMTLGLMAELPALGVRTRLITLGRALREAFSTPSGALEVASSRSGSRAEALWSGAVNFGADLIHGHLITGSDARQLSEAGMPVVLTIHNTRAGWPAGTLEMQAPDASILIACSQAVEDELRAAKIPIPLRTIRNGIDLLQFQPTPDRLAAGRQWRARQGFGDDDFVLIAVANPRPQKRLHLLPGILAAVQAHLGASRRARLVLCGEATQGHPEAQQAVRLVQLETERLGLAESIRWTGPVEHVAEVLAASDVFVSTSAHEGLSLAQLEALAMSCPVVAADVGGTREIAWHCPALRLLPTDAPPDTYAAVLGELAREQPRERRSLLPPGVWSQQQMAVRYRWLYRRTIQARQPAPQPRGLWLVTNNFSTGGAQSSARRLLLGLSTRGVPVRAAVVEEHPQNPTPGRRALAAAGIPVLSVPLDALDLFQALEELLEAMDADPPEAVVFWNLRPVVKVWLAEALLDTAVFDISPGEMYFDSLNRFFEKSAGLAPFRNAREYGARLRGVIVKYHAEAAQARELLGASVHVISNGVPVADEERPRAAALQDAGATIEPPANSITLSSSFPSFPSVKESSPLLVFGTAARLSPQKRLEDLIEAFRLAHPHLPAYTLRIAGGPEHHTMEYANRLREQAAGLPVEWVGELEDIAEFHRELDVFVMISEPAGCPNASLEAMAAGLPVVATDFGGVSEQVVEGLTGRLVPPRDPQSFADALLALAAHPELRERMGVSARERIRQHFSVARMVEDYQRVCLPAAIRS
jgi:glycosyltransferase involved in cell wall biosynthesis